MLRIHPALLHPTMTRLTLLAALLAVSVLAACDSATPTDVGRAEQAGLRAYTVSDDVPLFRPVPSPRQLAWHEMEMTAFIHYGWITYTLPGREFTPVVPDSINPTAWDPAQWARIARRTGMKGVIFVAKHHDGFSLWPSAVDSFNLSQTPFRGGRGDMVREAAQAIRAEGLEFGAYISPFDVHQPTYGTPAYNDVFDAQVSEVLGSYGPAFEVWFDGARGINTPTPEDNAAFNTIDFRRAFATAGRLQPNAVVGFFGTPPDFRWGGNEGGVGEETAWFRGDLSYGPDRFWQGQECAVPLRREFFWRVGSEPDLKTVDQLVDIYFTSQGRSCQLLLGLAPDRTGRIPAADEQRLYAFRARLDAIFRTDLAAYRPARASSVRDDAAMWAGQQATDPHSNTFWAAADGARSGTLTVDLGEARTFNVVEVREPIRFGQRVARHHVEGLVDGIWVTLVSATTVGYKRLHRIPHTTATQVRLVIDEAIAAPVVSRLALYSTLHPVRAASAASYRAREHSADPAP